MIVKCRGRVIGHTWCLLLGSGGLGGFGGLGNLWDWLSGWSSRLSRIGFGYLKFQSVSEPSLCIGLFQILNSSRLYVSLSMLENVPGAGVGAAATYNH
jgi:hypothetical protein